MYRAILAVLALLLSPAAPVSAAEVTLTAEDLTQMAPGLWVAQGIRLPEPDTSLPLAGDQGASGAATLLRQAKAAGGINGFSGILYDNRDRGHSGLPPAAYPQLARLSYGPALREVEADYGLAGAFLFPAVVFGNSSTAVTSGPFARSLPRLAMTSQDGPMAAARLYLNNHLYAYPEHRDHDAVDAFPANWPYMVISQGSSGSDRAFLQAIAATLPAFPADTFAAMRSARLVAPTLQMLLRRNLAPVRSPELYLSGIAHPVAFDGRDVRAGRMIGQAVAMRPEDIPPLVRLTVEEETFRSSAGLAGAEERVFDTPAAIARIWRGFDGEKEMVLSTAATADPFGRPLTFRWVLLRGDPEKVSIVPLDDAGTRARLRFLWHDAFGEPAEIDGAPAARTRSRVDIAVFAETMGSAGPIVSAPSFVTVSFPTHQIRTYEEGADGPRLTEIDYDALARDAPYDPALHWSAPWTDKALYDGDGTLRAWRRTYRDGRQEEIPITGQTYRIDRSTEARPVLAAGAE